jgi:phosphoenolpyruvate synthase/pyruvate phosphate dikinase
MAIRSLAEADTASGAKALGLARLIAAGQPVPEGFVIEADVFRDVAGIDLTLGLTPRSADLAPGAPDAIGHALAAAADRA